MAYRENRDDYMLALCVAIMYINMASQTKHPPNRNAVVTQVRGCILCTEGGGSTVLVTSLHLGYSLPAQVFEAKGTVSGVHVQSGQSIPSTG